MFVVVQTTCNVMFNLGSYRDCLLIKKGVQNEQ